MNISLPLMKNEPIYLQIASVLRKAIISGQFPTGSQMPTENELAERFRTTRVTLRKSLRILEQERMLVQRHGLGTFVTFQAPVPRRHVAVIELDARTGEYGARMLAEITRHLQSGVGCDISFIETRSCRDPDELIGKLNGRSIDGLIAIAPRREKMRVLCQPQFDHLPMVLVGVSSPELRERKRVSVETGAGAVETGVSYLYELGHRRIAYPSACADSVALTEREAEFRLMVQKYNLYQAPGYIVTGETDSWYDRARDMARELCRRDDRPTAFFCPGNTFAYGAWQGIMEAGLRIPEDVSIIGFDCERDCNPHLNSICQPLDAMADNAVRLLKDMLADGKKPSLLEYRFDVSIVDNGSCRNLNR